MKQLFSSVIILLFSCNFIAAQTTYERVYQIIQTNCVSCHSGATPTGGMDLSGSEADVLNTLVGVTPNNTTAAAKGFKRVAPGDARKSFLFHKINQGSDAGVSLQAGEGDAMPQGGLLSEVEREMIRQWIIFGAEDTGYHMVRENVITSYYGGFAEQRERVTPAPNPSEGFQIYYGPIFLQPGEEVEFDGKFQLYNTEDLEVYRLFTELNKESHHTAIYKFLPGQDTSKTFGLQRVNGVGDAAELFFTSEVVAQFPDNAELDLPANTGLFWDSNTVLTLSYHILNYSDSIIAGEAYMNVYTRPRQPNTIEMTSYPVRYDGHAQYQGGWDVQNLVIFPTGTDTTFTINQWDQDSTFYWNIWSIQAHTHQLGKAYNVYLRNPDGSKGANIYNGNNDNNCQFDTGFYDWEHPPLCYYGQVYSVNMVDGLIHEATFRNNGPDTVGFGLKTTDEMFVSYIFYYKSELPVGVEPIKDLNRQVVKVYPNPTSGIINFSLNPDVDIQNARLEMFDILGRNVFSSNLNSHLTSIEVADLPMGSYTYKISSGSIATLIGKVLVE